MSIESFDDFDSTEDMTQERGIKPFAFRDDKSEEGTLEWLTQNFEYMKESSQSRLETYRKWRDLYKGIHWRHAYNRSDYREDSGGNNRKPQMVDNVVFELVSTKVAQMARYGVNFTCIPWNNEISDIINAQACDTLLRSRGDELNMDGHQVKTDELKYIYGTSVSLVTWDQDLGGEHPAYKQLEGIYARTGKKIPKKTIKMLNKEGKHFRGDVNVENFNPHNVYPEPHKKKWEHVDHVDLETWHNIWEVKADYPNKADDIKENEYEYWDSESGEISTPADQISVKHFYHRVTRHEPGIYIKWCNGAILEMKEFPYEHGQLPIIVDRDIEIDGELWGRSGITNIEQMQRHSNNIESGVARDLGLGSAPKWVVPKGSVEWRSLGNDFTVAEYKGPTAPQLIASNPVSQHAVVKQEQMRSRMGKLMKVYDISSGDVPAGVTANSALRFLDEQESQALAVDEKKRKRRILDTYKMMLNIMSQYYQPEDERMTRKLGKNNDYMIENMKNANFSEVADIQIQNTSALPDTKSGKIAAITDLNVATQADPIFRREEVIEMLDLGLDDKFTQEASYSVEASRLVFESLVAGRPVTPPQMHDDLMVYYTMMFRAIQSISFKTRVKPEVQTTVYKYISTLEGLLWIKARKNPKLASELAMLNFYPMFFDVGDVASEPTPPLDPESPEMETGKMDNTEKVVDTKITQDVNTQTNLA